jgi:hydroxymethylglutaryl-CoA synthase
MEIGKNDGQAPVGIDALAMYTSHYAFDLAALAQARGVDANKYHTGLGQFIMSVPPPGEDIVTMAANAACVALQDIDRNEIEMVLFATESGVDQSKAAGTFVHGLLGLGARCRVVELKQACYSGTAGLQLALPYLRQYPDKKILLIAADIARYGLGTNGESSQGSAAVAMVLNAYPRVLAFSPEFGCVTENTLDFWRPNYLHEALVDGKYSSKLYLSMLEKCWAQYTALSERHFSDHAYFCYHTPVPRLVEKAHQHLLRLSGSSKLREGQAEDENIAPTLFDKQIQPSLEYARRIGNSYAASLYLGLISLLDHAPEDLSGKRIGFYSYGSGCVAEFFSGVVQPGYQQALHTPYHSQLLTQRQLLRYEEYERFFNFHYTEDGSEQTIPAYHTGGYRLTKLQQHKRIYEKVAEQTRVVQHVVKQFTAQPRQTKDHIIKVFAPGKLILSGEHAVVHGSPALAMAINRYVVATVSREQGPKVLFDLSDLSHHSQWSFDALRHLKNKIKQKYYRFVRGDYSIREVLHKPFELAQFAMGVLTEALNLKLPHGVKIHVQSDLPIGCGMGSSAATIISVMEAIAHYMALPLPHEKLYGLALEAENMQHGHSSGLDLQVAMKGGCFLMHGKTLQTRPIPAFPMYLINTGKPACTTGQCVEKTSGHFANDSKLSEQFAAVTQAMDNALQQQAWRDLHDAVRQNHRLLNAIGVVPARVQQFISQVEGIGGSAKVCGAGAVLGDAAGAVWAVAEDARAIEAMTDRFGYNIVSIAGEPRGVHAA